MKHQILEEVTDFLCSCGCLPAMKRQDKETIQAENKLTRELTRLFTGVEYRMISEIQRRGYIPQTPAARLLFVEEFLFFLYGPFIDEIVAAALGEAKRGRLIAFNDLKENGFSMSYRDFDKWTRDYLKNKSYTFSEDTARRIIGDVADNLSNSYEKGLGIDEAAQELRREIQQLRAYRLRTIARTEIQSAQNEGNLKTLEEFDVMYKQWISTKDTRTRRRPRDKADHVVMHGEVVKINERFSNGLLIPGDRTGDISEWINCRCRIRAYFPKLGEMIVSTPYRP